MQHDEPTDQHRAHEDAEGAPISRRAAIGAIGAMGVGAGLAAPALAQNTLLTPGELGWDQGAGEYTLPPLPYTYDALEPHIDAKTMQIHHDIHHAGYVRGLNNALNELRRVRSGAGDSGLIKHWSRELAFHAGGHINHTIFWLVMAPRAGGGGRRPSGDLAEKIADDFGSFDGFRRHFTAAAGAVEGSGWGWLVYEPIADRLLVTQAEKQQNLFVPGSTPLMGVDVWEHAYYLKYQNRRGDYVDAFMNVVNWPMVERLFDRARNNS